MDMCVECGYTLTSDEAEVGFTCNDCDRTATYRVVIPEGLHILHQIAFTSAISAAIDEITEKYTHLVTTTQKGA